MSRTTTPIKDQAEIEALKPRDKPYQLFDGQGLSVKVALSGAKHWMFNYYIPSTQRRTNISFGSCNVITLEEARAIRKACLRALYCGIDPRPKVGEFKKTVMINNIQ